MLHNKHFSLKEANDLVTKFHDDLSLMTALKRNLDEKGIDIYNHHFFGKIGQNGSGKYPEDLEKLILIVKKLSENGIVIKSIDTGLIDFPFIRKNGEEVYLCYQHGEDKIQYWHAIPDGFAGRRPIAEL